MMLRFVVRALLFGMMVTGAGAVSGQAYPYKPIRIVLSQAGGTGDLTARLIASGIAGPFGQNVLVENRAGGIIAAEIVSKAPPDGYTLLFAGSDFWLGPLMQQVPYDPVKDFSPVTLAVSAPNLLVVHPSVPVKSVKELIALAKARPAELNYASGAIGGSSHLAAELFKSMAGVNIVWVRYKGVAPALTGVLGGEVQLMFPSAAGMAPNIKSGKLIALAITSAQPSALFPGLPTIAASGVPGYEAEAVNCLWARAKTPVEVINRLNQEIVRVLNNAAVKEKFLSLGVETIGSSPQQLATMRDSDMLRMGKVIKDAGIKVE